MLLRILAVIAIAAIAYFACEAAGYYLSIPFAFIVGIFFVGLDWILGKVTGRYNK